MIPHISHSFKYARPWSWTNGGQQREEWKKEGRENRRPIRERRKCLGPRHPDDNDDDDDDDGGFLIEKAQEKCGENVAKCLGSGFRTVQGGKNASPW